MISLGLLWVTNKKITAAVIRTYPQSSRPRFGVRSKPVAPEIVSTVDDCFEILGPTNWVWVPIQRLNWRGWR